MITSVIPQVAPNMAPLSAEIFLLIAASAILLIDMFLSESKRSITYLLSLGTLVVCGYFSLADYNAGTTVYTFSNMFISDPMSNLLKLFSYVAVGLTLIYSRSYATDRGMLGGNLGGEFYVLALFSLLGQMVMISGNNMLSIYLGVELMSLSLYALVALRRDNSKATEAAMKYFILGALASGFLLYGISMLYGATGTLDLTLIAKAAASGTIKPTILIFGLVFLVAGLAFKLGVVPFHMWVPDVYEGSPTAVTLLLGGAPKLATFAIFIRLLVEGLLPMAVDWQQMLMVLAVLSLAIGNLTAIAQTNIKRMLASSTIAQMGFVLLGLLSGVVGTRSDYTGRLRRRHVLRHHLRADDAGQLRRHHADGPQRLRSRGTVRLQRPEPAQQVVRHRHVDPDVLAGRRAADDGLHGQVLGLELGAGHQPDLADRAGHDVLADRRVLLPARRQADVVR